MLFTVFLPLDWSDTCLQSQPSLLTHVQYWMFNTGRFVWQDYMTVESNFAKSCKIRLKLFEECILGDFMTLYGQQIRKLRLTSTLEKITLLLLL